ncbi:YbaK/EbsC family protein [Dongia sp.]|uniref:YbaK/EbsC family protein n=1 Tax=Dongia sp. TaxID=1977262 RepID=UPI0035AE4668
MSIESGSVARVRAALAAAGLVAEIKEFDASTRTAADAAAAIGCKVAEIAKSLIFRGTETDRAVLIIASGANRIDEAKVAAALGESIGKADAAFVRDRTGFAIGGVAPIAHSGPVTVLIDADLLSFAEIWAAAGAPNAVFRLTPADLLRVTGGQVVDVKV